MVRSPVSPESYDGKDGARSFPRMQNYEAGLEVAENQNREKNDLDPVVVLQSPADTYDANSPIYIHHGRWEQAPQVIDTTPPQAMGDAALERDASTRLSGSTRPDRDAAAAEKNSVVEEEAESTKRWCGISGKVLALILVLVLLLVAAIIGGAVGGMQARKDHPTPEQNSNVSSSSSSLSSSPSEGTKSRTSSSTKSSATSSLETNPPHLRFQLQAYEEYDFKGRSQLFTEPGLYRPAFKILSYYWRPAKNGDLKNKTLLYCSVAFCTNDTWTGWRGGTDFDNEHTKGTTNFLHFNCDGMWTNPDCTDLGLDKPAASTSALTMPVMETPGGPSPVESESVQKTGTITKSEQSSQITEPPSSSAGSRSRSSPTTKTQTQ